MLAPNLVAASGLLKWFDKEFLGLLTTLYYSQSDEPESKAISPGIIWSGFFQRFRLVCCI